MGEIHHRYVWYDDSGKQSGRGQASVSQGHLGSDVLTRICSEKKNLCSAVFRVLSQRKLRIACTCVIVITLA